jgi:uncharacterized protein (DUF433 family)
MAPFDTSAESAGPAGGEQFIPSSEPFASTGRLLISPGADNLSIMSRIAIDPDVCNGQPVVRGTRITVKTVLEFLAAGDSIDDVLEGYPALAREDVLACIAASAELLNHQFSFEKVA